VTSGSRAGQLGYRVTQIREVDDSDAVKSVRVVAELL
jgi:hypothetical protein